jgi:arginine/ornithine N-succinyltransferase beta subunit
VRDTRRVRVSAAPLAPALGAARALIGRDYSEPPYFRAVTSEVELEDQRVRLSPAVASHLGAGEGDEVLCLPLKQSAT